MNNLSSYYGLVDARISASDKYLPVSAYFCLLYENFHFLTSLLILLFHLIFTAVQDPVLNSTKTSIDYMRSRGPVEMTSSGAFFDHRAVSSASASKASSSKSNTANTGDFTSGSNNSSSDIIAKLTKEMLLSDSAAAAAAASAHNG